MAMTGGGILLVEDNADDVLLTKRALRKNGLRCGVVVVRDGAEALSYLLNLGGRDDDAPGLILLDLHLPKVDGLEVLERVRADERTRNLPVVLLVSPGGSRGELADRGNRLADLCVEKAMDFGRFVREVGRLKALLPGPELATAEGGPSVERCCERRGLADRTGVG
jgi:two-component system response regulator